MESPPSRRLLTSFLGIARPTLSLVLLLALAESVLVLVFYPRLDEIGGSVLAQLLTLYSSAGLVPLLACGAATILAAVLGRLLSPRWAVALATFLCAAPLLALLGVSLVADVYPDPRVVPSSRPSVLRAMAIGAGPVLALGLAWLAARSAARPRTLPKTIWTVVLILLVPAGLLAPCAYSFPLPDTGPRDALLLPPGAKAPLDGAPLVLVTVDTLRADHMSLYGYPRDTTPRLSEWARGATVFERCITTKSSTAPALASLHTGLYVDAHRVLRNGMRLDDGVTTLAERLSQAGYHCAGFAANFPGDRKGLQQGFKEWHLFDRFRGNAEKVFSAASEWIARNREKKYFVWVHVVDPHTPYIPPSPWDEMFWGDEHSGRYRSVKYRLVKGSTGLGQVNPRTLYGKLWPEVTYDRELFRKADYFVARYDGAIAFTDQWAGSFIDAAHARDPRAMVVFTADHGESMVEHDYFFFHGRFCYEPTAHIPLVIRVPSATPGRVADRLISLTDLFPTLCDLLGLSPAPCFEGRSFADVWFPDLRAPDRPPRDGVVVTARSSLIYPIRALRADRWKLILTARREFAPLDLLLARQLRTRFLGRLLGDHLFRSDEVELYDLEVDPDELRNVAAGHPEVVVRMQRSMVRALQRQFLDALALGMLTRVETLKDDEIEDLRALGYFR